MTDFLPRMGRCHFCSEETTLFGTIRWKEFSGEGRGLVTKEAFACYDCLQKVTSGYAHDISMSSKEQPLEQLRTENLMDLQHKDAKRQRQLDFLLDAVKQHRATCLEDAMVAPDPVDALLWDAVRRVEADEYV